MEEENNIQVNVLSDDPTNTDAFGGHGRVAQAIADLIKRENEGKSIALLGGWGSGKSSVVEMLRGKLGGKAEIFIFDAWAHEGDPLRRSFLEQLAGRFNEIGWLSRKCFRKTKKYLSRREISTTTESKIVPKVPGILLIIFSFIAPVGYALLTQISVTNLTNNSFAALAFFLALLPVLFLFLLGVVSIFSENLRKGFGSYFFKKGDSVNYSKSFRTPDPTSIEFQTIFCHLVSFALKNKKEKLIFVIDNLDRVDSESALSIWSTMKAFFEYDKRNNNKWVKQLWLLVPLSPKGVKSLWKDDNSRRINNLNETKTEQRREVNSLAEEFINKTFQITFDVAPPVLKDWKMHFMNQTRKAFPGIDDEKVIHKVYRIFRAKIFTKLENPTPRDIIIFINRVGSIYRQRYDDITLPLMALYVANEKLGNVTVKNLKTNHNCLIEPFEAGYIDIDYLQFMAAIYFNVRVEDANHVLLDSEMEKAINEKDIEKVVKLQKLNGFDLFCEEFLEERADELLFGNAANIGFLPIALEKISTDTPGGGRIWDILCREASQINDWSQMDGNIGNGIAKLIGYKNNDVSFLEGIIDTISSSPNPTRIVGSLIDEEKLFLWIRGHIFIFEAILKTESAELLDRFKCNADENIYIRILLKFAEDEEIKKHVEHFKPGVSDEAINATLSANLVNDQFDERYIWIIETLLRFDKERSWSDFLLSLTERLTADKNITEKEIFILLGIFKKLSRHDSESSTKLEQFIKQGHGFHHLFLSHRNKNRDITAMLIDLIIKYNPSAAPDLAIGQINNGIALFNTILTKPDQIEFASDDLVDIIIQENRIDFYLDLNDQDRFKTLVNNGVGLISSRKDITKIIDAEKLLKYSVVFYNALNKNIDQFYDLIGVYVDKTNLVNIQMKSDFNYDLAYLYTAILKAIGGRNKKFAEFIIQGLRKMNKEIWLKEAESGYINTFDLLKEMAKNQINADLSSEFSDALVDLSNKHQGGEAPLGELASNWPTFVSSLNENEIIAHISSVSREIVNSSKPMTKTIELYEDSLFNCEALSVNRDILISDAFKKFYGNDWLDELNWLEKALTQCPEILKKCNLQLKKSFKERIRTLLDADDHESEKGKILARFASLLNIKIKKKKTEDENDQAEE